MKISAQSIITGALLSSSFVHGSLGAVGDDKHTKELLPRLEFASTMREAVTGRHLQQSSAPNDPDFEKQWQFLDLAGPKAKDAARGGIGILKAQEFSEGEGVVYGLFGHDVATEIARNTDVEGQSLTLPDPWGRFVDQDNLYLAPETSDKYAHSFGLISAIKNNQVGVTGAAPKAQAVHMPVPLAPEEAKGFDLADRMQWVGGIPLSGRPNNTNPASVLVMISDTRGPCDSKMQRVIDDLVDIGKVIVTFGQRRNWKPSSCQNLVHVGGVRRDGRLSQTSTAPKTHHDIIAPGGQTLAEPREECVTQPDLNCNKKDIDEQITSLEEFGRGNSQWAPPNQRHAVALVGATAILLKSINMNLTQSDILNILGETAAPLSEPCPREFDCGLGRMNTGAAVEFAASEINPVKNTDLSFVTASEKEVAGASSIAFKASILTLLALTTIANV